MSIIPTSLEQRIETFSYGDFSREEFEELSSFWSKKISFNPLLCSEVELMLKEYELDLVQSISIPYKGLYTPEGLDNNEFPLAEINPYLTKDNFDYSITLIHEMIHGREDLLGFPKLPEFLVDLTAYISYTHDPQLVPLLRKSIRPYSVK